MKSIKLLAGICLFSATPAIAALSIQAQIVPNQVERFDRGIPTIEEDLPDQQAAVRVVPLPGLDHGSLSFKVAVYNKSTKPFNLGIENLIFSQGDTVIAVFSKDQLQAKAKNRAMWSQIGYAMLAGAAAAAQNNNTNITTYTPHGVYRTTIERPGLSDGQLASVAAGGGAIALSQIGLNKTLAALDEEIIQTTTLDPDSGYGGRIVCDKLKKAAVGQIVTLAVTINGETHLFKFKVVSV